MRLQQSRHSTVVSDPGSGPNVRDPKSPSDPARLAAQFPDPIAPTQPVRQESAHGPVDLLQLVAPEHKKVD